MSKFFKLSYFFSKEMVCPKFHKAVNDPKTHSMSQTWLYSKCDKHYSKIQPFAFTFKCYRRLHLQLTHFLLKIRIFRKFIFEELRSYLQHSLICLINLHHRIKIHAYISAFL